MREQLGREPTTPFVVVARCTGGHPLVIRNAPLDADGDPFPTTYWLTCPEAVKAVARLESVGWIARPQRRASTVTTAFAAAVEAAHASYAEDRAQDLARARGVGWGGRHADGHQVPARALRVPPRRRRGSGGRVGRRARRARPPRATRRPCGGDRSGDELVPAPGGGAGHASPATTPTELARDMVITRLGQGVDRERPDGRRTRWPGPLAVIARYCRRARALGAEADPRGRDQRRARRREPRGVRRRRARRGRARIWRSSRGSRRRRSRSWAARTGSTPPRCPVPTWCRTSVAGSTEFVMGSRAGSASTPPSPPRWGASVSPSDSCDTTRPPRTISVRWTPRSTRCSTWLRRGCPSATHAR